jgi:YbbR domain-containing protein
MIGLITRNWAWKLASLCIAFLIWLILTGSRDTTASLTAPVQYRNMPKNLESSSEMAEEVHVQLRGSTTRLARMASQPPAVVVDLSPVRGPGETTFTLTRSNVSLPTGLILERIIPSQIRLTMETRVARVIPIKAKFKDLPQGMVILSQEVTPGRIRVVGPESVVNALDSVETDAVDVRSLNGNGEANTQAYVHDPRVHLLDSPKVTVRASVGPAVDSPAAKQ